MYDNEKDKLINLALTPEDDFTLFMEKAGMRGGTISVTALADLTVSNGTKTEHYTYEQFVETMDEIKSK